MGFLSLVPAWAWRWIAIALVALAVFGFGYFKGNEHGTQKLTDYIGKQAQEAVRIVTARGQVTERVITEYVKVAAKTKTVKETVEKEVVRYETLKLDRAMLSVAAVSLHDTAAAHALPDTARSIDGTPSGIATASLLSTCTANYATYHTVADQLRGLQGWVRQQEAVR